MDLTYRSANLEVRTFYLGSYLILCWCSKVQNRIALILQMQIHVQGDVNSELALPLEEKHYHFIRPAINYE